MRPCWPHSEQPSPVSWSRQNYKFTFAGVQAATAAADDSQRGHLGLAVRPLSPQEQREAKVSGGLLVEGVNGPAARAGMQPGDMVLQADCKPTRNVEDLRSATKSRESVALLIQRGESRIFVPLKTG